MHRYLIPFVVGSSVLLLTTLMVAERPRILEGTQSTPRVSLVPDLSGPLEVGVIEEPNGTPTPQPAPEPIADCLDEYPDEECPCECAAFCCAEDDDTDPWGPPDPNDAGDPGESPPLDEDDASVDDAIWGDPWDIDGAVPAPAVPDVPEPPLPIDIPGLRPILELPIFSKPLDPGYELPITREEWSDLEPREAVAVFFPALFSAGALATASETVIGFLYVASAVIAGYLGADALDAWMSENGHTAESLVDDMRAWADELLESGRTYQRGDWVCDELHRMKDAICGGRRSSCANNQLFLRWYRNGRTSHAETCAEIQARSSAATGCLVARSLVTLVCFGGVVDPDHAGQEALIWQNIATCQAQSAAIGCGVTANAAP